MVVEKPPDCDPSAHFEPDGVFTLPFSYRQLKVHPTTNTEKKNEYLNM